MVLRQTISRVGENPYLLKCRKIHSLFEGFSHSATRSSPALVPPPFSFSSFLYFLSFPFFSPSFLFYSTELIWSWWRIPSQNTLTHGNHYAMCPYASLLTTKCMHENDMTFGFPCAKCPLLRCHMECIFMQSIVI